MGCFHQALSNYLVSFLLVCRSVGRHSTLAESAGSPRFTEELLPYIPYCLAQNLTRCGDRSAVHARCELASRTRSAAALKWNAWEGVQMGRSPDLVVLNGVTRETKGDLASIILVNLRPWRASINAPTQLPTGPNSRLRV